MDDSVLSALIQRRAALIAHRTNINQQLIGLGQEISTELLRRDVTRYEGVSIARKTRFKPFVAVELIEEAGLTEDERQALMKEVVDPEALKELRPDLYAASCDTGEPYLVQRRRTDEDGSEDRGGEETTW